eukprot:61575_1
MKINHKSKKLCQSKGHIFPVGFNSALVVKQFISFCMFILEFSRLLSFYYRNYIDMKLLILAICHVFTFIFSFHNNPYGLDGLNHGKVELLNDQILHKGKRNKNKDHDDHNDESDDDSHMNGN